jgi:hypothetical protein
MRAVCAAQQHSTATGFTLSFAIILSGLSAIERRAERERKASSSSLGYKPATNSAGYSGMFSNLSEILLFLVDQNHTRLAIDL